MFMLSYPHPAFSRHCQSIPVNPDEPEGRLSGQHPTHPLPISWPRHPGYLQSELLLLLTQVLITRTGSTVSNYEMVGCQIRYFPYSATHSHTYVPLTGLTLRWANDSCHRRHGCAVLCAMKRGLLFFPYEVPLLGQLIDTIQPNEGQRSL